jgi:hypothetical protein
MVLQSICLALDIADNASSSDIGQLALSTSTRAPVALAVNRSTGPGCNASPRVYVPVPQLDGCVAARTGAVSPFGYVGYASPPAVVDLSNVSLALRSARDPYVVALDLTGSQAQGSPGDFGPTRAAAQAEAATVWIICGAAGGLAVLWLACVWSSVCDSCTGLTVRERLAAQPGPGLGPPLPLQGWVRDRMTPAQLRQHAGRLLLESEEAQTCIVGYSHAFLTVAQQRRRLLRSRYCPRACAWRCMLHCEGVRNACRPSVQCCCSHSEEGGCRGMLELLLMYILGGWLLLGAGPAAAGALLGQDAACAYVRLPGPCGGQPVQYACAGMASIAAAGAGAGAGSRLAAGVIACGVVWCIASLVTPCAIWGAAANYQYYGHPSSGRLITTVVTVYLLLGPGLLLIISALLVSPLGELISNTYCRQLQATRQSPTAAVFPSSSLPLECKLSQDTMNAGLAIAVAFVATLAFIALAYGFMSCLWYQRRSSESRPQRHTLTAPVDSEVELAANQQPTGSMELVTVLVNPMMVPIRSIANQIDSELNFQYQSTVDPAH